MSRTKIGKWLAALGAAWIAVATLTPLSRARTLGPLCVVCGSLGGVDVILNVLLFVPLGFGLSLAGARAGRAIAAMFAFSFTIELLQLVVIPGRDASLGDLLMNSLGGSLGYLAGSHSRSLIAPRPRQALFLAACAVVVVGLIHIVAAYSLKPALPTSVWIGQVGHASGRGLTPFIGKVLRARVEDQEIPEGILHDPARLAHILTRPQGAWVYAVAAPIACPQDVASVVRIVDSDGEILMLAQRGRDLVYVIRTGASALRLRPLRFRLREAFAPACGMEAEHDALTVGARYAHAGVVLSARGREDLRANVVPHLSDAWRLIMPFATHVEGRSLDVFIAVCWTAALLLPVGYWSAAAWQSRAHRERPLIAGTLLAFVVIALATIPRVFGVPIASLSDWIAAVAALGAGAVGHARLRRLAALRATVL